MKGEDIFRPVFLLSMTFLLRVIVLPGLPVLSAETQELQSPISDLTLGQVRDMGRERSRFVGGNESRSDAIPTNQKPTSNLKKYQSDVRSILVESCQDCHGPDDSQGRLRIDQIDPDLLQGKDVAQWQEIYAAVSHYEMPPQDDDEHVLDEVKRGVLVDWLSGELAKASVVQRNNGVASSFRRLTNYEYNYALQDLLGLNHSLAKELPPETTSEEGFKNTSSMLQMSAMQFATYRKIGLEALQRAVVGEDRPETVRYVVNMEQEWQKASAATPDKVVAADNEAFPNQLRRSHLWNTETQSAIQFSSGSWKPVQGDSDHAIKVDSVAMLSLPRSGELKMNLDRFLPDLGIMRVSVLASRTTDDPNEHAALRFIFSAHTSNNANFTNEISERDLPVHGSMEKPQWIHFDIPLQDIQRNPFRKLETTFPRRDEFLHIRNIANTNGKDNSFRVMIHGIEITAPFYDRWPPKTHTDIFFASDNRKDEQAYGVEVLQRFLQRVWRRPVGLQEVEPFMQLFNRYRKDFGRFEDAMVEVLATALATPEFLYLRQHAEGHRDENQLQTDQFDFASKLAAFLWSSQPDSELLNVAEKGKLTDPRVLDQQISRMLTDVKSERLSQHFVSQWLGLEGLDATVHVKDQELLKAMRSEPIALFSEVLRENRSIVDFLHADYVMVNERLARHYGIRDVYGPEFQKVNVQDSQNRGGVLTSAAVLAMNSDGKESHPLKRGVWMLERILHDPPPPPPPNVPEVDLTDPRILQMTLKERLADHRNQSACKSCHARIDPWGIAFEQYDALGAFRTKLGNQPVDAKSMLFNRQILDGMDGLKRYLLSERQDQFAGAMVHKMLSYALGRQLTFGDHVEIERITREFRASEDRLGDLVRLIVRSELFAKLDKGDSIGLK